MTGIDYKSSLYGDTCDGVGSIYNVLVRLFGNVQEGFRVNIVFLGLLPSSDDVFEVGDVAIGLLKANPHRDIEHSKAECLVGKRLNSPHMS